MGSCPDSRAGSEATTPVFNKAKLVATKGPTDEALHHHDPAQTPRRLARQPPDFGTTAPSGVTEGSRGSSAATTPGHPPQHRQPPEGGARERWGTQPTPATNRPPLVSSTHALATPRPGGAVETPTRFGCLGNAVALTGQSAPQTTLRANAPARACGGPLAGGHRK